MITNMKHNDVDFLLLSHVSNEVHCLAITIVI
jgi:hypothetical protein